MAASLAKNNDRLLFAVEGVGLRVLPREMAVKRAELTRLTIEPDRNMRYAERGHGRDQIDEGELVHEIVKELAILDQVRLGDVQRSGSRMRRGRLRPCFDAGGEETREYIATIHAGHCSNTKRLWKGIVSRPQRFRNVCFDRVAVR